MENKEEHRYVIFDRDGNRLWQFGPSSDASWIMEQLKVAQKNYPRAYVRDVAMEKNHVRRSLLSRLKSISANILN